MLPTRSFVGNPVSVTVGTVDGKRHSALMRRFAPTDRDLPLESEDRASHGRLVLATERVAWVGFHREARMSLPAAPVGARAYRIYVAGGSHLSVKVDVDAFDDPIGFYAGSAEASEPYREFFFFNHGVNLKEDVRHIGELLVDEGHLTADSLAIALRAQAEYRSTLLGEILVEQKATSLDAVEGAAARQTQTRERIGELLVKGGKVHPRDVDRALAIQKTRASRKIGEILVELDLVSAKAIAQTLARKFHLPYVDLKVQPPSPAAFNELPRGMIERQRVLPFDTDGKTLTIALSDPLATNVVDTLRFQLKRRVRVVITEPDQVERSLTELLAEGEDSSQPRGEAPPPTPAARGATASAAQNESDSVVVRFANQIIQDAARQSASDIHIEPNGPNQPVTVRFRVDGDCIAYREVPATYRAALASRLKLMADLDITEKRRPQDGRLVVRALDRTIELRLATLPTSAGDEDVVMRLLPVGGPRPLDRLGLNPSNYAALREALNRRNGLVLCTGPTGSGKTATLHSALSVLNTPDTKIWTVEDPIEVTQPGLRQVQVNVRAGVTFATALRAFLRADPDVIMVGEMRDSETADIALQAALTGHLVLSTLHTGSAAEVVMRLCDMGLKPYALSDGLVAVLAQRLAQRLCPHCRVQKLCTAQERHELEAIYGKEQFAWAAMWQGQHEGSLILWEAKGCDQCRGSGYLGRIALHELLIVNDTLRELIGKAARTVEIRAAAQAAGMTTLFQDGVEKVLAGLTTMRQVAAVV